MPIDWKPFLDIVAANRKFVLTSHVRPDADALGSELAMAELLEAHDCDVRIINASETPLNLTFLDPDERIIRYRKGANADDLSRADVHIVLDTGSWVQLAQVGRAMRKLTVQRVVIDHHVSSDDLGAVEFRDATAEATGALIFDLAQSWGHTFSPQTAAALYCAIATDTGWFRFSSTTGETMRRAGQLVDAGAVPHMVYRSLYEQHRAARVHLAGCALSRVKTESDGLLAFTYLEWEDFERLDAMPADAEDLVNYCLSIAGTKAAFIAVGLQDKRIKISFRSRGTVDVAAVAEGFDGGGHKQASGAIVDGPMANALRLITDTMKTAVESAAE